MLHGCRFSSPSLELTPVGPPGSPTVGRRYLASKGQVWLPLHLLSHDLHHQLSSLRVQLPALFGQAFACSSPCWGSG